MKAFFIIFLLSLSAFAKETIVLEVGKMQKFQKTSMKLIKLNDSRCPKNAQCVWAGNILATVLVGKESNMTFAVGPYDALEEKEVQGFKMKIQSVDLNKKSATFEFTPLK